jgi:membrane protease subunit (stomatin/prohibitin family)
MALIDVIKWDGGINQVAWKFPSSNLRLGTQLIVKPGQIAFFVYRGKILDEVREGAITLKTANIPLLTKLISLPFGGDTPFQAEVWFINTLAKLDTKWGTQSPIQVQDPKYGVILPLRAFGQYGFRIEDGRLFLETVLGSRQSLTDDQIRQYFRGKVMASIGTLIGSLIGGSISFFNISAHLEELSSSATEAIRPTMLRYGILLEDLFFESINVPEDDPSYVRLRGILEKAGELNIVGRDIYQLDKAMDVLKTGAGNEGLVGLLAQGALGSGMGLMLGAQLGQQVGNAMQVVSAPQPSSVPPISIPPIVAPPTVEFFIAMNGKQSGPFDLVNLQRMHAIGVFDGATLVWREGMLNWTRADTVIELSGIFASGRAQSGPPPLPIVQID